MSDPRHNGLVMPTSVCARNMGVMRAEDQEAHQGKSEEAKVTPVNETCKHGAQDHDDISLLGPSQRPASNQLSSEATLNLEIDCNANPHLQHYQSLPQEDCTASLAGRRLVRFYLRTIVGILGPIIVVCYLAVIWQIFLAPVDPSSVQSFGPKGAQWVFYSWFIAGIIGLNLSLYGLAGAEAAMLMESPWRTKDAMPLMLHADRTWSGPGGWIKTMKWAFKTRQATGVRSNNPGRLWFILALPSVVVFTAWPLSGLCLEMTNGFVRGSIGSATTVTGFIYSDFNASPGGRNPSIDLSPDLRVPGYGAVYTPRDFDRSTKEYLQELPVTLPKNEAVEEIFLTAQSEDPIEGKAWGLLLHYDCRIIEKLSDMRLLNDRKAAADTWSSESRLGLTDFRSYRIHDNTTLVEARRIIYTGGIDGLADEEDGKWAFYTDAVLETAYETLVLSNNDPVEDPCGSGQDPPTGFCYYTTEDETVQHNSRMQQERVFEVLLWQGTRRINERPLNESTHNLTIDHPIAEAYGEYSTPYAGSLPAIGVSCAANSSVGTANIDGIHSTFSNFDRTDTLIPERKNECARQLGVETLVCSLKIQEEKWLQWLFDSVSAPLGADDISKESSEPVEADVKAYEQLVYLQASSLRRILLQAFSSYAMKLMYNNKREFVGVDGARLEKLNPNVTAFVAGTVITRGVVPASIPIALFAIWALISSALCLIYGFRRRWSETLDGHTVFRLGVELKDKYRTDLQKHSTLAEIEECSALRKIPGLVSDMEPRSHLGKIGLIEGQAADKSKFYI